MRSGGDTYVTVTVQVGTKHANQRTIFIQPAGVAQKVPFPFIGRDLVAPRERLVLHASRSTIMRCFKALHATIDGRAPD